jgi:hypothetical protein
MWKVTNPLTIFVLKNQIVRLEWILTMVYVVQDLQNFSELFPSSCIPKKKNTTFRRTETDPVSETLCFLEYRMMEKVQKNSVNPVQSISCSTT